MSQKYEKLKTLLRELFQLDQPDLDFGFYRVMHARGAEVTQFLEKDLLPQVQAAFAQYRHADKAAIEKELATVVAGVKAAGMNPDDSPKVMELRTRLAQDAVDLDALEVEVYDHLYSFFRRYYSEGDFLSKRVYKPGVYAIPYEGEEVKLHWANADQYYIKTSEYLRDYAFRLRPDDPSNPMRVHFRLADAAEGEHGNVKEAAGKERRFRLAPAPFAAVENGELVIRCTYQPDPAKQKDLNAAAEADVLRLADPALAEWIVALGAFHVRADGTASDATRLRVHLDRYTARNTFDYFIHRDLGGFLRRELDFYIKNEVMHLDDIESETALRVDQYLSKIKVIRRIAGKIIEFLAQAEDFQKKLWLKKKFVVETCWCIRLGVIPEEFYPEIAANDAQREEWVRLCAIDELQGTAGTLLEPGTPAYSRPLTHAFLKAHPTLIVDTRHFNESVTDRLIEALGDIEQRTGGVLIHSENFQALSLMQSRHRRGVDCIYIDPPYNTGQDDFIYKDNYQHSSWLSLIADRINVALSLLQKDAIFACSLNDDETFRASVMIDTFSPELVRLGEFVWRTRNTDNRVSSRLSVDHEYIHVFSVRGASIEGRVIDRSGFKNPDRDPRGPYTTDPLTGKANAKDRPNLHYTIVNPTTGDAYHAHPDFGWITDESGFKILLQDERIHWPTNASTGNPRKKRFLSESAERAPISSIDVGIKQGEGNRDLASLFGKKLLNFPKPVSVMQRVIDACCPPNGLVVDYFAGSGTTGEAIVRLNQRNNSTRRLVLVEMSHYFDDWSSHD